METKNSCIVHVWCNEYSNNDEALFIYDEELTVVHDVVVGDKVAYLQTNMSELKDSDFFNDDGPLKPINELVKIVNGFKYPRSTENAFVYRDDSDYHILFESYCVTETYTISEDSVDIGLHERIHRIRESDNYIVVRMAQWQGDTDTAVKIGDLDEIREYLESLGGRDIDEIINELTEL